MVLRYDGQRFERMPTPGLGKQTVYGVWGTSAEDFYAVGSAAGRNGFVWHYHGGAFEKRGAPARPAARRAAASCPGSSRSGASGDDVWVVGAGGTVLHRKGQAPFTVVPTTTKDTLFTVHGTGDRLVAVGGARQRRAPRQGRSRRASTTRRRRRRVSSRASSRPIARRLGERRARARLHARQPAPAPSRPSTTACRCRRRRRSTRSSSTRRAASGRPAATCSRRRSMAGCSCTTASRVPPVVIEDDDGDAPTRAAPVACPADVVAAGKDGIDRAAVGRAGARGHPPRPAAAHRPRAEPLPPVRGHVGRLGGLRRPRPRASSSASATRRTTSTRRGARPSATPRTASSRTATRAPSAGDGRSRACAR